MQNYYFIETLNGQIKTIKATDDKDFEENVQRVSSRKKVAFYSTSRKDIHKFIAEELKRLEKEKKDAIPKNVVEFCEKIAFGKYFLELFNSGTFTASHVKPYLAQSYIDEKGQDIFMFLDRNQLEEYIASDVLSGYQSSIFSFPEGKEIKFEVDIIVRINDNPPATKKDDWCKNE
jgi:hypothetical protein